MNSPAPKSSHEEHMQKLKNLILEDAIRQQQILDVLRKQVINKDDFLRALKERDHEFKSKMLDMTGNRIYMCLTTQGL